jgi:sugar phosphate isomerase/epimerase
MRLTVQLYTLRDQLTEDLEGTLGKVKAIGLEYVELAGAYDRTVNEWKSILDSLGLKVSGSHVSLDFIEADLDAVIKDNLALENPYIIVPWVDKDKFAGKWDAFGKQLEVYGQKVKEAGLELAYHNHDFEFVGDGLSALYASSDPELVKAELDLAWISIAGQDPAAWIQKLSNRVPLLHLKDYDPTKDPQWTPAGQGTMDYDAIIAAANAAGVSFGGIELDVSPIDPIEAVKQSFEFLSSKGLS